MGIKLSGMDEVEALKGSLLPVGVHDVVIESADETESKNGHPQVELLFISPTGLGDIRDWLTFAKSSPEAWEMSLRRAKTLLDAVGIEAKGGDWEFPVGQLPGKRLSITVGEEPKWNDPSKTVRKVKAYAPAGKSSDDDTFATPDDELPF